MSDDPLDPDRFDKAWNNICPACSYRGGQHHPTCVNNQPKPTDLSRLLDWYRSVGIEPKIAEQNGETIVLNNVAGDDPYYGLEGAGFVFTREGRFVRQDFW